MTPRRWALIGLAALLAVLGGGYLTVALSASVAHGDSGNYGPDTLTMAPDSPTQIMVTVRNTGRLPIELTGVGLPNPNMRITPTFVLNRSQGDEPCCTTEQAEPWRPVTISPHGQALVWLNILVTTAHEYPPCSSFSFDHLQVHFTALGLAREQDIALTQTISFKKPC